MIPVDLNKFILSTALLILAGILIVVLVIDVYKVTQENGDLRKGLEQLEESVEREKAMILVKVDSLQKEITNQNDLNISLQGEILELERDKDKLKLEANERKAAILGITDVDSLRSEIARHYRR